MSRSVLGSVLACVAMVMVASVGRAEGPATTTAPAAEKPLFGFEDDSKGPFTGENVTEGPTVVAENATEGAKSLMIGFEITDKNKRTAFRVDKPKAFLGAKTISFDLTYVGNKPKGKIRITLKDAAGKSASEEQTLAEGKTSMTLSLADVDAAKISSFKITLDNYTGKGKLFLDNVRITN